MYVCCTLMDESRQCLTCLLLLTPMMFPAGNHFKVFSLFSVFVKLLFTPLLSMLFSLLVSQISIKSLLLFWARGETDLTWSSSKKSKISASHCCLTVSSLQAVLCLPVSCLLRTPDSWIRLLPLLLGVQCSVPGPRPARTRSRIKLFRAGPPASRKYRIKL